MSPRISINKNYIDSVEQSPSWETNSHPASQEISFLSWNPIVYLPCSQELAAGPILGEMIHSTPYHPISLRSILVSLRSCVTFKILFFYVEELLASRPTSKLEDRPLPAITDCVFSTFTVNLQI